MQNQPQAPILSGLPMALLGVALVMVALLFSAWPPDFEDSLLNDNVSHWARLTGNDAPPERIVMRPDFYPIRRGIDALAYYMLFQSLLAIAGLALSSDRHMYILLIISGVFGVVYAGSMALVIGPMIAAVGFALILWTGLFGWFSSGHTLPQTQSYRNSIEVTPQVVREER